VFSEWLEIPITMQQLISTLDAPRGDYRIDRLTNSHAQITQRAKISRRLDRDLLTANFYNR
jgi:hypothetical protein